MVTGITSLPRNLLSARWAVTAAGVMIGVRSATLRSALRASPPELAWSLTAEELEELR